MDENAVRAALESVLVSESAPVDDDRPCIMGWRDNDGYYYAVVFNAERFAVSEPGRYAGWIMGKPDREIPCLNPPHPSDRDAIKLLPKRLQKRIAIYEKQKKKNESAEGGNREVGASL